MKASSFFIRLINQTNLSVSELAELADVSPSFIYRLQNGQNSFEKLDRVFDIVTDGYDLDAITQAIDFLRKTEKFKKRTL